MTDVLLLTKVIVTQCESTQLCSLALTRVFMHWFCNGYCNLYCILLNLSVTGYCNLYCILLNLSVTAKAAPRECVNRTGLLWTWVKPENEV